MSNYPKKIIDKIKKLPNSPGVYKFLDSQDRIIYVGKAISLKKRVSSYFRPSRVRDNRLELLVSEVRNLEIIKTASEAEALIYEAGLIKDHAPKFNIDLKDDKSYPYLKLTVNEKYPRLYLTRRRLNDGAIYYGPYVNVRLLKEAVSFMKRVFPLRTCNRFLKTVCLEYHLGQCAGPCEGKISLKEYGDIVSQLKKFLEGKKEDLIHTLECDMKKFSKSHEYEKALLVKERIEGLTAVRNLHDSAQKPMYGELDELQCVMGMSNPPVTIECFDISNIGGKQAVGSMVKFTSGLPQKSEYRKFRIKNVEGIDDYSMISEVVFRRYSRLLREKKILPDLVLIDGGRGHLSVALNELKKVGAGNVPIAAIAKEHNHLYTQSRQHPVRLPPGSRLLALVQRIRDEAHRFAITYHRSLRRKAKFDTGLRNIPGIGIKREKKLLDYFGTMAKIQEATVKELQKSGLGQATAKAVKRHFSLKSEV